MTINRAQSQTLKSVGIYLPSPVFSHGQLYVAMSRVGCADAVKFFIAHDKPYFDDPSARAQTKWHTANVVFPSVL